MLHNHLRNFTSHEFIEIPWHIKFQLHHTGIKTLIDIHDGDSLIDFNCTIQELKRMKLSENM